jgi:hypothetical protein
MSASYVQQLKYKTDDQSGKIVGGGFPLSEYVKSQGSQMGGSIFGSNKFEHLVIPISIDSHDSTRYEPMVTNKVVCREVIEDDVFDRLFSRVGSIKQPVLKTRKNPLNERQDEKTKATRKKSNK